jgi:uridine kinase
MDELVTGIVELRRQLGRGVAVGVSGIDCAGKTTLAAALQRELERRGLPVLVISGDEFTRPTAERYAEPDLGLGYYRDSFDYAWLFDRLLPVVRSGEHGELTALVSDWDRDSWQPHTFRLSAGGFVIVEGCFLFTAERGGAFDLGVWIDISPEDALTRAQRRAKDLERMGGPDGVRERYLARYLAGQELHLARDAPKTRADVLLSGYEETWTRGVSADFGGSASARP